MELFFIWVAFRQCTAVSIIGLVDGINISLFYIHFLAGSNKLSCGKYSVPFCVEPVSSYLLWDFTFYWTNDPMGNTKMYILILVPFMLARNFYSV